MCPPELSQRLRKEAQQEQDRARRQAKEDLEAAVQSAKDTAKLHQEQAVATALAEAAAEHTAALRQAEDDAARDAARLQAELKEMAQVGVQGVQLLHSRGKNTSLFTDTQSQVRDAEANARAHLAEELSRAHTEMEEISNL